MISTSLPGDFPAPDPAFGLLAALHYLKYTFNLSDEDVVEAWVENPYWQHFGGNQYFEHGAPIDPSVMSRFRTRIGEAGIAQEPEHAFVDMGYRGHNYEGGGCEKRRRGNTARSLWKWMKRRAAIEPGIGHLKRKHRMDRCRPGESKAIGSTRS